MAVQKVGTMNLCYDQLGQWGRLGNQLWEIASTFGLARTLQMTPMFNHWDYEEHFSVPLWHFTDAPKGVPAAEFVHRLPISERWYMQDYGLWSDIADDVRRMFGPSKRSLERLWEDYVDFLTIPNKVALHVRRDERVVQYADTHPTPSAEYYLRAMELEKERLGDPTFAVFSDDIEWCRQNLSDEFLFVDGFPRHQNTYLSEGELPPNDHLDLFLMTNCVGHIIANSTYSWWGAFLSGNQSPIYPAKWYGPSLQHIDWRLQIPPGWREVEW